MNLFLRFKELTGRRRSDVVEAPHIEIRDADRHLLSRVRLAGQALARDVAFGLRVMKRAPAFTATVVITLALAIGASTVVFSLVYSVIIRSLPIRNSDRLILLQWQARRPLQMENYSAFSDCADSQSGKPSGCSFPVSIFNELREDKPVFSHLAGCAGPAALTLRAQGPPSLANAEIVAGDYFGTLGVTATIGRTLAPADDTSAANGAVVLSYSYWERIFNGDISAIGRTISLNNVPVTIVGVAERRFTNLTPGKRLDLWMSMAVASRLRVGWVTNDDNASNWWLLLLGRLQPGVSAAGAELSASSIFRNAVVYGPTPIARPEDDPRIVVASAEDTLVGNRPRVAAILDSLGLAVLLLMLIACTNVGGLLLSRALARQREMAVRRSLGASPIRLLSHVLVESLMLSLMGGATGAVAAYWSVRPIAALLIGDLNRFWYVIGLDWRAVLFTLAICFAAAAACGVAPAAIWLRVDGNLLLKRNSSASAVKSGVALRTRRIGETLIIGQISLSVTVLACAGLLVRTVKNLTAISPGFETSNLLLFGVDPGPLHYNASQTESLYRRMRERLDALPGVTAVSYSSDALLAGGRWSERVLVEGQADSTGVDMSIVAAGPDFFKTLGIPVLEGRTFSAEDFADAAGDRTGTRIPLGVVVNAAFARTYFASSTALRKTVIHLHGSSSTSGGSFGTTPRTRSWYIVGVVGDTPYDTLRHGVVPVVFVPFTSGGAHFELRTRGDPRAVVPLIQKTAAAVDSGVPLMNLRTEQETIDASVSQERVVADVFAFFGVVAVALMCLGVYGMLAYEVSRRAKEMAIRIALGAAPIAVLRQIVWRGVLLMMIGGIVGLGAAAELTRFLTRLLYGVRPNDPSTLIGVAVLLTVVTAVAGYIPARKAMRLDPISALKQD